MIRAGIMGAAGYAGIECARILLGHPDFELVYVASDSDAGKALPAVYPTLLGKTNLVFEAADASVAAERCDIVFLAVPHTASLNMTPELLAAGCIVIDLSADYRLRDPEVYAAWYDTEHTSPELLEACVYGLPEENRAALQALQNAENKLVACAGCYPTASTLAALPLLHMGLLKGDVVISDCVSGVSGAGRKAKVGNMYCTASEDAQAYGVATHRHTPEIAQTMSQAAGRELNVVFTPHLIPVVRGLLSTVYLPVEEGTDPDKVRGIYEAYYADEPFVTVLPAGQMPHTSEVRGSNEAHIGLAFDPRANMVIASCAIDNLMKGAASQAVQCANIVCGLPEETGLRTMLPPVI